MKNGVVQEYYDLLRLVVDHGAYAVVVVGPSNIIQITNPAADRLFARTAEELVGQVFPFPVDGRRLPKSRAVEAPDGSWSAEMSVERADLSGRRLYVVSLRELVEDGLSDSISRELMLVDSLTGLLNERGFKVLTEQQMKLARRTGNGLSILVADVDGMHEINDAEGRPRGDLALKEAAMLMRHTFRDSDVVARLRDDEFALTAIDAHRDTSGILVARLRDSFWERNAHAQESQPLSVSTGIIRYEPAAHRSIAELLDDARAALDTHRREKGRGWFGQSDRAAKGA